MFRLNLSTVISAPIREVFEYVSAYDDDGPVSQELFAAEYGRLVESDGDGFIVEEDVRRYPEDDPDLIRWRCTVRYPESRSKEALNELWAHRMDRFRSVDKGTAWKVSWTPRARGLKLVLQYLVFQLIGRRRLKRELVDPVRAHFEVPGLQ